MKLSIILWLYTALGFFILWLNEMWQGINIKENYWLMMFSLGSLLFYAYKRGRFLQDQQKNRP